MQREKNPISSPPPKLFNQKKQLDKRLEIEYNDGMKSNAIEPKPLGYQKSGKMRLIPHLLFTIVIGLLLLFLETPCSPNASHTIHTQPTFGGFAQLDETKTRLIFVGDTQLTSLLELFREDNRDKMPLLIQEIHRHQPALILNLGDLVFCGSSQSQWSIFDKAHQLIIKDQTPYFPLPGNHEYWCNPIKTFQNYFARFQHLQNRTWYSFRFRSIGVILLNSNFSKLTKNEQAAQLRFYNKTLAEFNADNRIFYIIVCCHNPPYTNSKVVHPDKQVQQDFVLPFLKATKTVAFLSGHCHSYEKFKVDGKYFIVSGGGGGPRQKLDLSQKKHQPVDQFNGPELRFLHFCQIDIQPKQLHFQIIKLIDPGQFSLADEFTIPTFPNFSPTKVPPNFVVPFLKRLSIQFFGRHLPLPH